MTALTQSSLKAGFDREHLEWTDAIGFAPVVGFGLPYAARGIGRAWSKVASVRAVSGAIGVAQDVLTGIRLTARELSMMTTPLAVWAPGGLPGLLANIQNARQVRRLFIGAEAILKAEVAAILAAEKGISSTSLGIKAGANAEGKILQLAQALGLNAKARKRLNLPSDLLNIPGEGLASYRVADIYLSKQKLALEITLESAQDLWRLSIHKQGQLADYYLTGSRVAVINPW